MQGYFISAAGISGYHRIEVEEIGCKNDTVMINNDLSSLQCALTIVQNGRLSSLDPDRLWLLKDNLEEAAREIAQAVDG